MTSRAPFEKVSRRSGRRFSLLEKGLLLLGALVLAWVLVVRPPLVSPISPQAKPTQPQTSQNAATSNTSATATAATSKESPKGVDLSHYQSQVNWQDVKASGLSFVYSKATEGNTGVDHSFAKHRAGANTAGLLFGGYHFYRPNDDPITQANHFLKIATPKRGELPPALDLEISPNKAERSTYIANVIKWLEHVKKETGCAPIIYASPSFWRTHLGAELASYGYWLAEYSKVPKPPKSAPPWLFWQHSQKGHVSGIKGMVDLDIAASEQALQNALCKGDGA